MLQKYEIGIYTIDGCGFCDQAKALLIDKDLKFKEQKIETSDERMQLKNKYPEARSFPIIIIDHQWIGGFSQLMDWIRDHKDDLDVSG